MANRYSEDSLIEKPAINLFQSLSYSYLDCFHEIYGEKGILGREISTDISLLKQETLVNDIIKNHGNEEDYNACL
ncbi:MAG: hypothetical protein HY808_02015 [Nitrospirae bacterium]|nr:hypothetical protein [Nitrospirota bacterium]